MPVVTFRVARRALIYAKPKRAITVNYIPRKAVIVSRDALAADFAESTMSAFGLEVSRYDSTKSLSEEVHGQPGVGTDRPTLTPDIAILVGSTSDFVGNTPSDVANLADVMPVIVTSSTASVSDAVELMKHGAKDVVQLPCDRNELWQRVQSTLENSAAETACKATMADMRARLDLLTPAEHEVVDAMLDGLANKQIAQRLGIGLRTVELRRSKIMRKMQAKSVAELVKFICMSGKLRTASPAPQA